MNHWTAMAFGTVVGVAGVSAHGATLAYYSFDGTLADGGTSAGPAVLGDSASLTGATSAVGSGALSLAGSPGTDTAGNDGAVSTNSFTWATDTRSVAFWAQVGSGGDTNATMLSLGSGTGGGNRFDIRASGGNLRLEVQSGGTTTGVGVADGNWYHIAVVVPSDGSTVATSQYYVHDTSGALVAGAAFGGSGTGINTQPGPLRIGDSYQDTGRDFAGLIDEVYLYDTAITQSEAQALAAMYNPVPEPSSAALLGVGALLIARRRR